MDASDSGEEGDSEGPGLLEWAIFGAAAAPWAYVAAVLLGARDPSTMRTGFSGFVTNPASSSGGPGGPNANGAAIQCSPPFLVAPPLVGSTSTTVQGLAFIPFEYVDLFDATADPLVGTIDMGSVQAGPTGAFDFSYSPKPLISGAHLVTAVDSIGGVRITAPYWVQTVVAP